MRCRPARPNRPSRWNHGGDDDEIASLAAGNADRSRNARELMVQLGRQTDESNRMLDAMIRGMEAIRGSSDGIARIIRTIDEIAFQTNVLSLNAASKRRAPARRARASRSSPTKCAAWRSVRRMRRTRPAR